MTVSFLYPTPVDQWISFFKNGRTFICYTAENYEICFTVIDERLSIVNIDGDNYLFDCDAWILMRDDNMYRLSEIIPCGIIG